MNPEDADRKADFSINNRFIFMWSLHVLLGHNRIDSLRFHKIGTHKIISHHCPENGTVWLYCAVIHPKALGEMANSVDPDKTAPFGAV